MARPIKDGLEYFPMDVDFFNDEKLQFISARFDEKGELITIKLLCRIYRNGYFLNWDDDMALLFSKGAGRNITHSLANDVVTELLKRDFFDKDIYMRHSILTSNGIQKRYIKICKQAGRKFEIDRKYLVNSEETLVNSEETPVNLPESTERKVKESKGNNSLTENSERDLKKVYKEMMKSKMTIAGFIKQKKPLFIDPYVDLWNLLADERKKPHIQKITTMRQKKFNIRINEDEFDFLSIISKAAKSEFIMTKSFFTFDWIIENQDNYIQLLEGKYDNNLSQKQEVKNDDSTIEKHILERDKAIERQRKALSESQ